MAATVERRFGTDLSNVSRPVYQPKKKSQGTNVDVPKVNKNKVEKKTSQEKALDSLLLEMTSKSETKTLSEISYLIPTQNPQPDTTTKTSAFVYSRDFLLALRPSFSLPIEGIIPEVLPGYIDPVTEESPSISDSKRNSFSSPALYRQAKISTPVSSEEKSFSRALNIEISASPQPSSALPKTPMKSPKGDLIDSLEESLLTPNSKAEWRLKKKKEKLRETDSKRLTARQKQIDIGMNTVGYRRYLESVPSEKRSLKAPDVSQVCSKRSWDGQVRKWRRELHKYDPEGTTEEPEIENDDDTGDAESPQNSPDFNRTEKKTP